MLNKLSDWFLENSRRIKREVLDEMYRARLIEMSLIMFYILVSISLLFAFCAF